MSIDVTKALASPWMGAVLVVLLVLDVVLYPRSERESMGECERPPHVMRGPFLSGGLSSDDNDDIRRG